MPPVVALGWRGPEATRLVDQVHAGMVETVASSLSALGWEVRAEYSFNHFGERGSADILAWRARDRAMLIVETKSRLWDLQDTLARLDRKARVVPGVAAQDLGWRATAVGVLLVMPETRSHRRVVERHAATFAASLPGRQMEVRRWLSEPRHDLRGVWFLTIAHQEDLRQRARARRALSRRPEGGNGLSNRGATARGRRPGAGAG